MKILLDECLPIAFRLAFATHEAHTAAWAGFKGLKNGELLQAAESAGYELLLTVDQNLSHQQTFRARSISTIVLVSRTNQLEDLIKLVGHVEEAMNEIRAGEVVIIE